MSQKFTGIAASPGIAIAPAFVRPSGFRHDASGREPERPREPPVDPEGEWRSFLEAVDASRTELVELRDRTRERLGDLKAEIFDAHLSILKDPELSGAVSRNIKASGMDAGAALEAAAGEFTDLLAQVEGDLFRARIDDIRDLTKRILSHLDGCACDDWGGICGEVVVVAEALTPSETSQLDPSLVKAFVTAEGSLTSHSSILARSMEIPAVVGIADLGEACGPGSMVIVDGSKGIVIVDPSPEELERYGRAREGLARTAQASLRFAALPTKTRDGRSLELSANIGGPKDSEQALAKGAEGVGLFRTEFLYMDRPSLPTEDEQYEAYRSVLEAFAPRPVVVRTLDIGGDKAVECLKLGPEPNPFLGIRAIRLCFAREDIFRTQLRALLRAGGSGRLRIMFPMIAAIEELRSAKRILEEERRSLASRGIAAPEGIEVGIMIEIPGAAAMADRLAREADFFSVGTNDLVQYTMAADRMNAKLAYLNQALHPAILRLMGSVAEAAKGGGIWAGVCGEMAADPLALPLLVGMGFDELSMSAASIPAAREAISTIDGQEARALFLRARDLDSADEVRELVGNSIK
jgi:phosphoenolpyruvate-protein phosphotransferase (PTS system enzyme I)